MKKRVLIADDHAIVRSGIKFFLKDVLPFAVIHEACGGHEVMLSARKIPYDLIILDINMPETDYISLIGHLFACNKNSKVLIFSVSADELSANKFLKPGAWGYLNKEWGLKEVKSAIAEVSRGAKPENPFEKLSAKERLIAHYYLKGYTSTEIKKMLRLHASTIGTLKTRLFGKLRIKSMVALAELARLYRPDFYDLP